MARRSDSASASAGAELLPAPEADDVQAGQYQSSEGTSCSGGLRQSMWNARPQPSPSQSSISLPSIQ
eukprot:6435600-Prymnesium_polylepis.1